MDAPAAASAPEGTALLRRSSGLREFWKAIQLSPGLQILDLGSASQANISFITDLGLKLYTADLLHSLLLTAPAANGDPEAQFEFDLNDFFRDNLNYADGQFDGILCWDLFDYVSDPLIKPLIEGLHRCLKPGGIVLSFFHTGQGGQQMPMYQYRIRAEDTLQMTGRGMGRLQRHFNNRTIENLFRNFASLKFYLSRDSLREVIGVRYAQSTALGILPCRFAAGRCTHHSMHITETDRHRLVSAAAAALLEIGRASCRERV